MANDDSTFEELAKLFKDATQLEKFNDGEVTPDEPYKSKYAARKIYEEILAKLDASPTSFQERRVAAKSTVLLHLGINAYETEEVADGERRLLECISCLGDFSTAPYGVSLFIHASNHIGIVWNLRKDEERSLEYFKRSESAYENYKANRDIAPDSLLECFEGPKDEPARRKDLETLHTHTLYFLAQCYERLGEKSISAGLCHRTLLRQLASADYDVLDWSRNCAILSQFYVGVGRMRVARHCLAASSVAFGQSELKTEQESVADDRERTGAEIRRCWGAYVLSLLRYSREMLAKIEDDDRDPDVPDELLEAVTRDAEEPNHCGDLFFVGLDEEKIAEHEAKVACRLATGFDEARQLFLFGTRCLDDAKSFYTKIDFCSDYVSILQSASQFYKLLSAFEPDVARRCKMHKRRADSLGEILDELNPTYYLTIIRQLRFEIGEIFAAMMDLKYAAVEKGGKAADTKVVAKINSLTKSAVDAFQDFILSFQRRADGDADASMPETLDELNVRPVLLAYFHVARLYTKFVERDHRRRIVNTETSLGFYQKLVDYVEAHPDAEEFVKSEYEVAKELIPMMDIKIKSLKSAQMT